MMSECITSSWLVDTGASYNITGNSHLLVDIESISACLVGLSRGEHIVATQYFLVDLAGGLTLRNVIIVPRLQCNLIFVS